jgi:hypothetical protein
LNRKTACDKIAFAAGVSKFRRTVERGGEASDPSWQSEANERTPHHRTTAQPYATESTDC